MKRLTVAGTIRNIEMKQGGNTGKNYLKISVEELIMKMDGSYQFITNYVSVWEEYIIEAYNTGHYQIGNAVVMECNVKANAYTSKDGVAKASLEMTAKSVVNLNLATVLGLSTQEQSQAQPQYQVEAPRNASLQGQPLQGQPLQGQPLQGQPLQGQPLQGQVFTTNSYNGHQPQTNTPQTVHTNPNNNTNLY